jgi:hypothetical protein
MKPNRDIEILIDHERWSDLEDVDFPGKALLGNTYIVVGELYMGRRQPTRPVPGQVVTVYPARRLAIVQLASGAICVPFEDLREQHNLLQVPHET